MLWQRRDSNSGRANSGSEFDEVYSTMGKASIYETLGPAYSADPEITFLMRVGRCSHSLVWV